MTEKTDIEYKTAIELVLSSFRILDMVDPEKYVETLKQAIDNSFYMAPTLAQQYLAKRDEVDSQVRILEAAATFVAVCRMEREKMKVVA